MPTEITVDKTQLLDALKKNRETHRAQFLKAQEGYKARCISELETSLDAAREGHNPRNFVLEIIQLPEPKDHTKDYDREIGMLEMHIGDRVEITNRQYEQFVMDLWDWSKEFRTTSLEYTVS